jgi:LacI family transcriptional regulator
MKVKAQQVDASSSLNKTRRRTPTVRTVAKYAGVSVATVSRTLSRLGPVNPETAERVHQAIKALGYSPDVQAGALRSGRSRLFGLIVPRIANPLLLDMIQHIEQTAADAGYEVLVTSIELDSRQLSNALQRMMGRRVEGAILLSSDMDATPVEQRDGSNLPLVCINPLLASSGVCSLHIDYESGLLQAVRHLIKLGHLSICFVRGAWHHRYARMRWEAFEKIMQAQKLSGKSASHGKPRLLTIEELLHLRGANERPTAAICANDITAMKLLQRATQLGIRVPEDLSIVGIDDNHISRSTFPELTTIRFPSTEIASAAVNALLGPPSTDAEEPCAFTLETSLIVRNSTGRCTRKARAK